MINESMNQRQVMIKKIRTADHYYLYEIYSAKLLRVNRVIFDIVDHFSFKTIEEVWQILRDDYSYQEIHEAYKELEKSLLKNVPMQPQPVQVDLPFSKESLRQNLDQNIAAITLNVTDDCNMRCKYCYYSGNYLYPRHHAQKVMSKETAIKAIDFFFQHNFQSPEIHIGFFGGEPLLNFSLIKDCIAHAKKSNLKNNKQLTFMVTTNGTLLNDQILSFLVHEKIMLIFSLDGDQKTHDENRVFKNGQGSFAIVAENIQRVQNQYPDYYKNFTGYVSVIAPPYQLSERAIFFDDKMIRNKALRVNYMSTSDMKDGNREFLNKRGNRQREENRKLFERYCDAIIRGDNASLYYEKGMFDSYFHNIHNRFTFTEAPSSIPLTALCVPGQGKLFIDTMGNFRICEKADTLPPIGNVNTGFDFEKIEVFLDEYITKSRPKCSTCWAIRLCSICYINAYSGLNYNEEKKNQICEDFRSKMERYLTKYCEIHEKNNEAFNYLKPGINKDIENEKKSTWEFDPVSIKNKQDDLSAQNNRSVAK